MRACLHACLCLLACAASLATAANPTGGSPNDSLLHLSQASILSTAKEGKRASLLAKFGSSDADPICLATLTAGRLVSWLMHMNQGKEAFKEEGALNACLMACSKVAAACPRSPALHHFPLLSVYLLMILLLCILA